MCSCADCFTGGGDSKSARYCARPAVIRGGHQCLRCKWTNRPSSGCPLRFTCGSAGKARVIHPQQVRGVSQSRALTIILCFLFFFSKQALLSKRPPVYLEARNFEGNCTSWWDRSNVLPLGKLASHYNSTKASRDVSSVPPQEWLLCTVRPFLTAPPWRPCPAVGGSMLVFRARLQRSSTVCRCFSTLGPPCSARYCMALAHIPDCHLSFKRNPNERGD